MPRPHDIALQMPSDAEMDAWERQELIDSLAATLKRGWLNDAAAPILESLAASIADRMLSRPPAPSVQNEMLDAIVEGLLDVDHDDTLRQQAQHILRRIREFLPAGPTENVTASDRPVQPTAGGDGSPALPAFSSTSDEDGDQ